MAMPRASSSTNPPSARSLPCLKGFRERRDIYPRVEFRRSDLDDWEIVRVRMVLRISRRGKVEFFVALGLGSVSLLHCNLSPKVRSIRTTM